MNQTLTAKVGANVLTKVTRLFDGSPKTIFNEMVQNSRRAGSQKIEVQLTDGVDTEVTFRDDGVGVADLEQILTLADSGWQEPTISDEDPAGMGIFVLSALKDPVILRSRGNEWTLTPKVFQGLEQATVREIDFAPGLEVCFTLRNIGLSQVTVLLESAVRNANIQEVTINGSAVESGRYVENSALVAEDPDLGVRLAIRNRYRYGFCSLSCCFHGLMVHSEIEESTLRDICRELEIDLHLEILHSRRIKLVLPARNALVAEGLEDLWQWLTARVFEYVAKSEGHTLPYDCGRKAAEYGVTLPPLDLRRALKFWPGSGRYELISETRKNRPIAIVRAPSYGRDVNESFVSEHKLFTELNSADSPYLYARAYDTRFEGYSEYDSLPRLAATVEFPEGKKLDGDITIVDELRFVIRRIDGSEVDATDLKAVFASENLPRHYLECEFSTIAHKDSLDPIKLAQLLYEFGYSYDAEAESSDDDLGGEFITEAERHFFSYLMSPEDAMKHAVTNALHELLLPDWNHGKAWGDSLTIRLERVRRTSAYGPADTIKITFE